jgi:hypothetical protein
VSAAARSVALLLYAISTLAAAPGAPAIRGSRLEPLAPALAAPFSLLTRWLVPAVRSRAKMSRPEPLPSPKTATRLLAAESNATQRPSSLIAGSPDAPFAAWMPPTTSSDASVSSPSESLRR